MSYKYFYFLILFGISLLTFFFLLTFYLKLKANKNSITYNTFSNSALFLGLALFSWTIIIISKFFDGTEFSLTNVINDRVFSTLSNLFFVLSVNYMPSFKELLKSRYKISGEHWFIGTLVFFTLVLSSFLVADKMKETIPVFIQSFLIIFDSVVSISSLLVVGFAINFELMNFNKINFVRSHLKLVFFGLCLSQLLLPLSKIFPNLLLDYYPYFLSFFLVFLAGFFQIIYLLYPLILIQENYLPHHNFDSSVQFNENNEIKFINFIGLEYETDQNKFLISLEGQLLDKTTIAEVVAVNKLIQPLLYWFLFAISTQKQIKLFHSDMAILKFRMTELWNKNSNFKLSQEVLFSNDNSNFEINCKRISVSDNSIQFLKNKVAFKTLFLKHFMCFIDSEVIKEKQLKNKKNFDAYSNENFEKFYNFFFHNF
jgi:hypothetical protein